VEEYTYYVNKLRQKVGLETWVWRQIVTSQTANTKYKWPPHAAEWNPYEDFLRTPLNAVVEVCCSVVIVGGVVDDVVKEVLGGVEKKAKGKRCGLPERR